MNSKIVSRDFRVFHENRKTLVLTYNALKFHCSHGHFVMRSSSMSWFLLLTFNTSILITQSNQLTEEGHKAFEMGIRAKIYHETPFCEVMSIHVVYKHPKIIFFIWRFWSETTLNTINTGIKSNCLFNFTRGISKHSPEKRSTVMRLLLTCFLLWTCQWNRFK